MLNSELLNILIVDDNQNNLLSLHSVIDEYFENVKVFDANSGIIALDILMRKQIDLIILDIQMPEMDGFEIASIIRTRQKTQHIPIVFLTAAYKSEEFKKKGYAIGAADYLTKPIETSQLVNKIQIYLRFIRQEHQHTLNMLKLERQVEERNAELTTANQLLKQEIIERKQIEERLNWAKEQSDAASLAKSRFLANMSHELRTPLNVIIGYSEMLEEEAIHHGCEDFTPDIEKICLAGRHLLNLINDVLDITKIETGKMTLHCETFDLSTIIHQMISSVQPLMEKQCNTLQIHLDDGLGKMYADVTKLRQILLNLLSNAAKFTEKGIIALRVTSSSDKSGFNFIVTDTGIGMNVAQINDLFQLFTQVDSSSTRKYGGAGLGLAITKQFTDMMGGTISVKSELGQGSTFSVELPVKYVGTTFEQN